jgi:hypothetical protein
LRGFGRGFCTVVYSACGQLPPDAFPSFLCAATSALETVRPDWLLCFTVVPA